MSSAKRTLYLIGGILNILVFLIVIVVMFVLFILAGNEEWIRDSLYEGDFDYDPTLPIEDQVKEIQILFRVWGVVIIFFAIFLVISTVFAIIAVFKDSIAINIVNIALGLFSGSIFVICAGILGLLVIKEMEEKNKNKYNNELL
ncbi:MAG: hypothetical protein K6E20_01280 [Acholeplasmatales bacterium]|nr:hypothetical protein [Acholeplasmatales bacterium]